MQGGITVRNAEIQIVRCTENNSKNTLLNSLYTIAVFGIPTWTMTSDQIPMLVVFYLICFLFYKILSRVCFLGLTFFIRRF